MKCSLLIYDYAQFYIETLKNSLKEQKLFDEIVYSNNVEEFLRLISTQNFDFIITSDRVLSCKDLCELINEEQPKIRDSKFIFLGDADEIRHIRKLFEHGVIGYFESDVELQELISGLQSIVCGNVYICNSAKERMLNYISFQDNCLKNTSEPLTKRELEVMKLICDGFSSKCISEKLFISLNTVETHRKKILLKLNVKNSVGIFKYAVENKMLE